MRSTSGNRGHVAGFYCDHVCAMPTHSLLVLVQICNKLYCLTAIEMTMELLSIEWDEVRFGYFT